MEAVGEGGIAVKNLTCGFEGRDPAIRDLSFSVVRGEALAIIGPSGSGKTALALCLTGIIPKKVPGTVEGEILIDGRDIREMSFREVVRKVNIVMQSYEMQIFGLTVEEDILFGLENLDLGDDEIARRLSWALSTFRLDGYRDWPVSSLSGGLKQRLAIASTAALQPDFIVMDDPTSNLDWVGIKELRRTLLDLKAQGKGVIVLSSRIKGLEGCFDKVVKLDGGDPQKRPLSIPVPRGRPANRGFSVVVEDLWFGYSSRPVLKGVSLHAKYGEVVAIMGPNGSGKTTLAKHFNGLLKPARGESRGEWKGHKGIQRGRTREGRRPRVSEPLIGT